MTTTRQFTRVEVDWIEVKDLVSFDVLRPTSIPDEARLVGLSLHSRSESPEYPLARDGIILAFYRVGEDGFLKYEQGWGMGPPRELDRAISYGTEQIAAYDVTWVIGREPGGVGSPYSNKPDEAHIRVAWQIANGPGWKLTTDSLSLQELFSIVESLTTQ